MVTVFGDLRRLPGSEETPTARAAEEARLAADAARAVYLRCVAGEGISDSAEDTATFAREHAETARKAAANAAHAVQPVRDAPALAAVRRPSVVLAERMADRAAVRAAEARDAADRAATGHARAFIHRRDAARRAAEAATAVHVIALVMDGRLSHARDVALHT